VKELQALYREAIRRHAAQPVGFRKPIGATHVHECSNPLCGDRVEISLKLSSGMIEDIAFDGEACRICLASASLLCEQVAGQPADRLRSLHDSLAAALHGQAPLEDGDPLAPLLGVRSYPSRIRCAMLPWEAAVKAIA
jgi:nitrogen fixation NifU-like protein